MKKKMLVKIIIKVVIFFHLTWKDSVDYTLRHYFVLQIIIFWHLLEFQAKKKIKRQLHISLIYNCSFEAKSIRNNSKANECEHLNNSEVEDLMGRLQKIKAELNNVKQEKEKREDVIKELNSGKNSR